MGKRGIKIEYTNPQGKLPDCNLVIYSDSLSGELLEKIKERNLKKEFIEVGKFKRELIERIKSKTLLLKEREAVNKSNMFPLINFDPKGMKLIGITGTDGKTTVVNMIFSMLSNAGFKPGMISTVKVSYGEKDRKSGLHVTTPSSQDIINHLEIMRDLGCTHAVVECTSQGLYMGRVFGLKFDIAVYTNIKRDHLGYHKTWLRYLKAKSFLIEENLKKNGISVLNFDDKKGFKYLKASSKKYFSYSILNQGKEVSKIWAENITENINGISFTVSGSKFQIPIIGKYNVSNALASISVLKILGINIERQPKLLKDFQPVEGRMNVLQRQPFTIIVDFAHTPNGLLNALRAVSKLKQRGKKLILVFGCASKRDDYKRPIMGRYAKRFADITILTAEDCRSESLKEINNQIEKGWREYLIEKERKLIRFDNDKENVKVRRNAIVKALSLAEKGDIVLITGKGHEKSLCFGLKEYPWNEIEEVNVLITNS